MGNPYALPTSLNLWSWDPAGNVMSLITVSGVAAQDPEGRS